MARIILVMLFVSCAVLADLPAQTGIVLPPVADTWVDSSVPAANYGTDTTVKFGRLYDSTGPNPLYRTYLLFNLAPFAGRRVAKAELGIYQWGGHAAGTLDKHLCPVSVAWNELSMTWNNKAAHGPFLHNFRAGGSSKMWIVLDVTSQVQAWLDGAQANHGFVYKHPREDQAGASRPAYCYSREYIDPALRPYLRIDLGGSAFGSGCGGPQIGCVGDPGQGMLFNVGLRAAPPGAAALLFLGKSDTQWGILALPFDLGILGHTGCSILCEWMIGFPGVVDAQGLASRPFPIPIDPSLAGAKVYWQWVLPSVTGGNLNLLLSEGLQARIF